MSIPSGKTFAWAALGLAILLAPWPAGSVGPGAFHGLAVLAALAAVGLSLSDPGPLPQAALPFLVGLLAWSAWVFIQMIPLPASWIALASPQAYQLHVQALAAAILPEHPIPISLTPALTRQELIKLAAFTLAFAVTAKISTEPRLRTRLAGILFAAAGAVAVFGLGLKLGGLAFAWLPAFHHVGPAIGPFANHNHFADFVAAPALIGLSLLQHRSNGLKLMVVSALAIMGLALFASGSRAGLLTAGGGLVCYLLTGKTRTKLGWAGFSLLALSAFATKLPSAWLARVQEDFFSVRWPIWNSALLLSGDFPWTGAGAGSFAAVEPAYSLLQLPVAAGHAHCDYLEWLAEAGAPVLLVAAFTFAWGLAALAGGFRSEDRLSRGALAGVAILLGHSLVDFSFHVPAVALAAAVLLGLAVSGPPAATPPVSNPRRPDPGATC